MRAARYLGVPPWDLVRQSAIWRDWALIAEEAEEHAKAEQAKRK